MNCTRSDGNSLYRFSNVKRNATFTHNRKTSCFRSDLCCSSNTENSLPMNIDNNKGFSLIGLVAATIIVVISMISLYIGIVYVERQMACNYHERAAMLIASGEIEWQVNYLNSRKVVDVFREKQVVLDYAETKDGLFPKLRGKMTLSSSLGQDLSTGMTLEYIRLTVKVTWRDPATGKNRSIRLVEDVFL